jgi:hypothetical protein
MGRTLAALAAGAVIVAIVWFAGTLPGPFPQIIGQNCGEVSAAAAAGSSSDPDEAELCLWQAYRTCRTATLVFSEPALDFGGSLSAITVQPHGGRCELTDAIQGNCSRAGCSVTSHRCASLQQQNSGLLVQGCGTAGDIYLPPRPADEVGHVCGIVTKYENIVYTDAPATVASVEDCFWRAYLNCVHPATLIYETIETDDTNHTLTLQRQNGTCVLTDVADGTHPCTGMTRASGGGLAVRGCAVEGDFTIPPGAAP